MQAERHIQQPSREGAQQRLADVVAQAHNSVDNAFGLVEHIPVVHLGQGRQAGRLTRDASAQGGGRQGRDVLRHRRYAMRLGRCLDDQPFRAPAHRDVDAAFQQAPRASGAGRVDTHIGVKHDM